MVLDRGKLQTASFVPSSEPKLSRKKWAAINADNGPMQSTRRRRKWRRHGELMEAKPSKKVPSSSSLHPAAALFFVRDEWNLNRERPPFCTHACDQWILCSVRSLLLGRRGIICRNPSVHAQIHTTCIGSVHGVCSSATGFLLCALPISLQRFCFLESNQTQSS